MFIGMGCWVRFSKEFKSEHIKAYESVRMRLADMTIMFALSIMASSYSAVILSMEGISK